MVRAAVELADRSGLESLSMRKLGQELGVEAMALYRHVRDKDDLLDGIVEAIVGEIEPSQPGEDWKAALRDQVMAARHVMLRHPWARRVLEERGTAGPAMLGYIESVLAILREWRVLHRPRPPRAPRAGQPDRRLQPGPVRGLGVERSSPAPDPIRAGVLADRYPRVTELAQSVSHEGVLGPCDDDVEFAFGLDLILEGLDRQR